MTSQATSSAKLRKRSSTISMSSFARSSTARSRLIGRSRRSTRGSKQLCAGFAKLKPRRRTGLMTLIGEAFVLTLWLAVAIYLSAAVAGVALSIVLGRVDALPFFLLTLVVALAAVFGLWSLT